MLFRIYLTNILEKQYNKIDSEQFFDMKGWEGI